MMAWAEEKRNLNASGVVFETTCLARMDVCTTLYFGDCQCSNVGVGIAHFGDASYYPQSGFFRNGRRLFCVQNALKSVGRHFWAMLLRSDIDNFGRESKYNMYLLFMRYRPPAPEPSHGWAFPITAFLNGATPIVHLWRIQRAVRRWLTRRWEGRSLALMMSSDLRLGGASGLALLPPDLVRQHILDC
jgi:hypothetical protein